MRDSGNPLTYLRRDPMQTQPTFDEYDLSELPTTKPAGDEMLPWLARIGNGYAVVTGDARPLVGLKWAALGTSITIDAVNSYVPALATLSGMSPINLAVVGASLSTTSSYLGGGFQSQVAAVPLDTKVVTVECGANDFRGGATLGSLGDKTLATFYGALYKTLTDIIAQDWTRRVVVLGMYPNTLADSYQPANYLTANANGNYFFEFQRAMREVCEWLGVGYVPIPFVGGPTAAAFLTDGIHLSASGKLQLAKSVYPLLQHLTPVVPAWSFRNALRSDLSADRIPSIVIDSDGTVQVSGQPTSGQAWAALWLADGVSFNACEFEIADPSKGVWVLFGRTGEGEPGWIGKGDPSFDQGRFNYIASFSALGAVFPAGVEPITNMLGVYPTKFRIGRIGSFVSCQALISGNWLQAFNLDLDQQSTGISSQLFPQSKCGILVASSAYTRVKNVRVGTFALQ